MLEKLCPTPDILINNAGITGFENGTAPHDPEHVSLRDWHDVHRTNLDGTFLGCRYALRCMGKRGTGSIINISSRSGLVGIPGAAAYASSKAAIRNHTKTVALYAAQKGWTIRCNSVHPAAILTPLWDAMLGDGPDRDRRMEALVADTPLKRFGTIEEVAALCVMLASDEARYVTGSELSIEGGLLAGSAAQPDPDKSQACQKLQITSHENQNMVESPLRTTGSGKDASRLKGWVPFRL
ncbi:SDR family NAD(P)-dependent oxidoreductase [Asaia astilbis]|uniref:SDR family NAD(P)-dependent oxidoreductase n=1 Tax=Asaia astilbis TaxID=610244 RepID=UPI0035716CD1